MNRIELVDYVAKISAQIFVEQMIRHGLLTAFEISSATGIKLSRIQALANGFKANTIEAELILSERFSENIQENLVISRRGSMIVQYLYENIGAWVNTGLSEDFLDEVSKAKTVTALRCLFRSNNLSSTFRKPMGGSRARKDETLEQKALRERVRWIIEELTRGGVVKSVEVAEAIGMTPMAVSKWKTGFVAPSPQATERIVIGELSNYAFMNMDLRNYYLIKWAVEESRTAEELAQKIVISKSIEHLEDLVVMLWPNVNGRPCVATDMQTCYNITKTKPVKFVAERQRAKQDYASYIE